MKPPTKEQLTRLTKLSLRQKEVAWRIAEGKTHAQIAEELCVSLVTVKNQSCRVTKRMGAKNGHQVTAWIAWYEAGKFFLEKKS